MTFSLLAETNKLLESYMLTGTIQKLSKDSGISDKWLYAFHNQVSKDPGVTKVQALYDFLSDV